MKRKERIIMVEQLLRKMEEYQAYLEMEANKESEARRAFRDEQLGAVTEKLYGDAGIAGVIVGVNDGEADLVHADVTVIGFENDRSVVKSSLDNAGYQTEEAATANLCRLRVGKADSNLAINYEIVFGKHDSSSSKIIEIDSGNRKILLRISDEKVKIGGREVPKIYKITEGELENAYLEALARNDLAEVDRLSRLFSRDELQALGEEYKADKGAEKPASTSELAKAKLVDADEYEDLKTNDAWKEMSFEYAIDELEGEILRAQARALETWEADADLQGQEKLTANDLYGKLATPEFLTSLNSGDRRNIILAALPQIKGDFTKEEMMILVQQIVIEAMNRTMVERTPQGDKRHLSLLVQTRKLETANVTGGNKTSQAAN